MYFSAIGVILFSGVASSYALPELSPSSATSLLRRDYFDCNGSALCGSAVNFIRDCDIAVNHVLIRDDEENYGASGYVCHCFNLCYVYLCDDGIDTDISLRRAEVAASTVVLSMGIARSSLLDLLTASAAETTCGTTTRSSVTMDAQGAEASIGVKVMPVEPP